MDKFNFDPNGLKITVHENAGRQIANLVSAFRNLADALETFVVIDKQDTWSPPFNFCGEEPVGAPFDEYGRDLMKGEML